MTLVGPRPPLKREVAEYSDFAKQRLYGFMAGDWPQWGWL